MIQTFASGIFTGLLALMVSLGSAYGKDIESDFGKLIRHTPPVLAQAPPRPDLPKNLPAEFRPSYLYPEFWTTWSIGALVRALAIDSTFLWVGTTDGIIRYHRAKETQTVFTTKDGLMSNIVLTIRPEPEKVKGDGSSGRVWIGTYGGGLSHFDGDRKSVV